MRSGALASWEVIAPVARAAHLQLALDETLLDAVIAGRRGPTLRLWDWSEPAVVVGSHQSVRNEVDLDAAAVLGFRVARRMSGGGAMIVEPERCLTYSIYAPAALVAGLSFADSYEAFDGWLVDALRRVGVPAQRRAPAEVSTPAGKIAGSAQARRRGAVLHHTTMAYAMDTAIVPRLLRIGRAPLVPRGVRSAERTVTPFRRFSDMGRGDLLAAMCDSFARGHDVLAGVVTADELSRARRLAAEKYASPAWIERLP